MSRNLRFARWLGALALAAALLGASSDAYAQQRPPPPGRPAPVARPAEEAPATAPVAGPVSVGIKSVRATNTHDKIDASLKPIAKLLSFTKYTGFELIDTYDESLDVGEEATLSLKSGHKMKVELVSRDDAQAKLHIRLLSPDGSKVLDTTISVHRNRSFMVAGPKMGEDVLILPVTASY